MKRNTLIILFYLMIFGFANSQTWHQFGNPQSDAGYSTFINSLKIIDNKLYVLGAYSSINSINIKAISTWNGENWDSVGTQIMFPGEMDVDRYNNCIFIGGDFFGLNGDNNIRKFAKWDGLQWNGYSDLPINNTTFFVIKTYNNKLYAGGNFQTIGTTIYKYIAAWNDTSWSSVGGGLTGGGSASTGIYCMEEYMGDLIVGGVFSKMGSTPANNIARWDGSSWHALAGGVGGMVTSLCVDTIHNLLYVGGNFQSIDDTISGKFIAKWDVGSQKWYSIDSNVFNDWGIVYSMSMFYNDLYVGGIGPYPSYENLKKWDGSNWTSVYGPNGTVQALAVYKGNLFAGGNFNNINGDTTIKYLACYGDSCPLSVNTTNINISKSFLGNNIPNPSKGTTIIPYNLPIGKDGMIKIHSVSGVLKKQYAVSPESKNLEVDTIGWQKGTYIYSLYIDGQQVESRKMVVQ